MATKTNVASRQPCVKIEFLRSFVLHHNITGIIFWLDSVTITVMVSLYNGVVCGVTVFR